MRYLLFISCFGFIFFLTSTGITGDYPYRAEYPEVTILELTDMKSVYDKGNVILVDVRSKTEFDVIHIKDAINIPFANAKFTVHLSTIAKQNPTKKIVVYGNGIDCLKSYKAAEDAVYAMVPNVSAYDAGIVAWALAYPSATLLLGDELTNSQKQLISEDMFIKKNLNFETFKGKARNKDTVVMDIRDPIQRKQSIPGLEKVVQVSLDKLVKNIISQERMKDKQLLIFDQVGRQANWLMYYLVDNGYTDFYFLNGGATTVLKNQDYRVTFAQ